MSKNKDGDDDSQLFSISHSFFESVIEEQKVTLAPFESQYEIYVELHEGVFLDKPIVHDMLVIFDKFQVNSEGFLIMNDEDNKQNTTF